MSTYKWDEKIEKHMLERSSTQQPEHELYQPDHDLILNNPGARCGCV
jgi:hypothetical protein